MDPLLSRSSPPAPGTTPQPLPPALADCFQDFEAFSRAIPVAVLERVLRRLPVSFAEVRHLAHFDPDNYRRNRLWCSPTFDALLLCWRPGQRSPIHDHRGSACGFRVLAGTCCETRYELRGGTLLPSGVRMHDRGTICVSVEADIHRVANESSSDLVTLHVYSPRLENMRCYEEPDRRRQSSSQLQRPDFSRSA